MTLITIITPTFNCASTLDATLESVVSQDFTDFEYWLIDGGSTDGTRDRLAAIQDPRVRWISEPDRGIYDAMNKGIDRARGRYLLFLGADDLLLPGSLRAISDHLPATDRTLVYGNVYWGNTGHIYGGRFSRFTLCQRNICHQSIFFGRDVFALVGKYVLKYPAYGDWDFNMRCFGDRRIRTRYVRVAVSKYNPDGASSRGDPAFEADKLSLIRTHLGWLTLLRYRLHLRKKRWLAARHTTP